MSRLWYIATTKHQQEQIAAAHLRAQTFGVYLPKKYDRPLDARKGDPLCSLRFPGYIFIEFDFQLEEHGPIANTRGVDELLCRNDEYRTPLALRPLVVDMLRQIEDEEFAAARRRKAVTRADMRAGDQVVIDRHDYFRGYEGRLVAIERGIATVIVGAVIVTLADCDLKKTKREQRRVA